MPRSRPRRAPRFVLAVTLIASACGGGNAVSGGAGGGRGGPVAQSGPTYAASLSPAYRPPADLEPVYTAAGAGGTQSSHPLAPDEGLASLARSIAERIAADAQHRAPGQRVTQALAWSVGVIDPAPAVLVFQASGANAPLANVTSAVADMVRNIEFNTVGVGKAAAGAGNEYIVVTLAQRRLGLSDALPRRFSAGARVQINGRVADGLRNPEIAITHPDGRSEHFPLGEGPEFLAQFPARARGTYQVEVVAEGPGGSTVLANFPVYVDIDPPATPEDVASAQADNPEHVAAELLDLINASRREAGRAPLQTLGPLTQAASAHSQDMSAHHFVAHNSPTNGTPSDRLRRAGLQSGTVLENLARGYNAREIHDGLMSSPGHRANLLSERVTHVGIGVAPETGAGGGLLVTEDFIEVNAMIDVAAAPQVLLDRINNFRTRRGAQPVTVTPQLHDVAARAAGEFFTGHDNVQAIQDRANRQLNRLGLIFRRVAVLSTIVTRLDDAGGLEPLLDPGIGSIGIGVAQGTRPDAPPNAIFVVFAIGYPR